MFRDIIIRIMDILVSFFLLLVSFPLMIIIVILCCLVIGLPPFYYSERIGKSGRKYRHLKFRSMKKGPETGREYFELKRINGFGSFIRKFHLDELPELFLILAGIMSLVGPRPLEPRHLEKFNTEPREMVRPGWTGLAQIKLVRKGILYGPEQIILDNIYIKRRSFGYNLKIIAATLTVIFKKPVKRIIDPEANAYRKEHPDNPENKKNKGE